MRRSSIGCGDEQGAVTIIASFEDINIFGLHTSHIMKFLKSKSNRMKCELLSLPSLGVLIEPERVNSTNTYFQVAQIELT